MAMTVYDKLDWHLDAALSAGKPEENAFSHIGLYLGWLVRNEVPRSPIAASFMKLAYWTYNGRSSPSRPRSCAMSSGEALSPSIA